MTTATPGRSAVDRRPRGWIRFTPLLAMPVPVAWFAYTLAFNPTDRVGDPAGPCLWHALFGIDGPSCGLTRLTWYLLHGDLIDATRMHLAAFLLVPVGAYAWLWWAAGWVFGRQLPMLRVTRPWVVGYAVFFVVYAVVLRNLPWESFTWFTVPNLT